MIKSSLAFLGKYPELSALYARKKYPKEVISPMVTKNREKLYKARLKTLREKDEVQLKKHKPSSSYTVMVDTVNLDEVVKVYNQKVSVIILD